ncbi:phosphorylated adapter RNA export protein [Gouania willdenowi]|uniref:Phosphorylated adapter RNA export protein n=1 Tax=Gouania willdenowi TaxID=441366 RepID=A0A8C5DKY8_GOUWI|nr:phosphorylated adapter RNA export protein [Gouania willdenowi]
MANGRSLMDADLEDGEISGSDSEITAAQAPSLQSRASQSSANTGYRSSGRPVESSDSDPDSSGDEAALWRKKRQKVSNPPPPPACLPRCAPTPAGRKVNNIWGSVVQEQCQDSLTAELGIFGMEGVGMSSRDVETYNFVLAKKIMENDRKMEKQQKNDGEVSMLDAELEDYMKGRGTEDRGEREGKRKRSAKERLGPRAEMDIKGRFEITEDDSEETVISEIAYRLQEPKKDLIERVVCVLGKKKAIELLGETAALEENGGVYTLDGSRRRTPGGVYLNLMKNTPSITKAQIRKIFIEEQQKEVKSKKAAQKRRRQVVARKMKQAIGTLNLQEHDDVSRETFASDTNEALESLEEVAGEEAQEEAAIGTEDTPVIYSSADLEVF